MPTFRQGDVVRVAFPYTDRSVWQARPALVISDGAVGPDDRLLWVVMITSAENRPWERDVPLGEDYAAMGLPAASIVRPTKIAVVETAGAEPRGHVPPPILEKVLNEVLAIMRQPPKS